MAKANVLSDDDLGVLRRMIDRERKRGESGTILEEQDRPTAAPETYIAYLPTPVPALAIIPGTGTGANDLPGKLEDVDIYRINDAEELEPYLFSKTVYNLNLEPVGGAGQPYVVVTRGKFGKWLIPSSIAAQRAIYEGRLVGHLCLEDVDYDGTACVQFTGYLGHCGTSTLETFTRKVPNPLNWEGDDGDYALIAKRSGLAIGLGTGTSCLGTGSADQPCNYILLALPFKRQKAYRKVAETQGQDDHGRTTKKVWLGKCMFMAPSAHLVTACADGGWDEVLHLAPCPATGTATVTPITPPTPTEDPCEEPI